MTTWLHFYMTCTGCVFQNISSFQLVVLVCHFQHRLALPCFADELQHLADVEWRQSRQCLQSAYTTAHVEWRQSRQCLQSAYTTAQVLSRKAFTHFAFFSEHALLLTVTIYMYYSSDLEKLLVYTELSKLSFIILIIIVHIYIRSTVIETVKQIL